MADPYNNESALRREAQEETRAEQEKIKRQEEQRKRAKANTIKQEITSLRPKLAQIERTKTEKEKRIQSLEQEIEKSEEDINTAKGANKETSKTSLGWVDPEAEEKLKALELEIRNEEGQLVSLEKEQGKIRQALEGIARKILQIGREIKKDKTEELKYEREIREEKNRKGAQERKQSRATGLNIRSQETLLKTLKSRVSHEKLNLGKITNEHKETEQKLKALEGELSTLQ